MDEVVENNYPPVAFTHIPFSKFLITALNVPTLNEACVQEKIRPRNQLVGRTIKVWAN